MIYSRLAVQRALRNRDPGLLQVAFEADVLDRYRGKRQFTIMRTDSAGRVRVEGGWVLDFGIADNDRIVHASWQALAEHLPEEERVHWAEHAVSEELSENFLRMQLAPGACFEDGELRTW
jgi:hypothetical protein